MNNYYYKKHNTALIYGVTGQDGSYLSDYLLSEGYKVVGVTRRCSVDNTINIKHLLGNENFLLLEGDVSDYMSVSGNFNQASGFLGKQPEEVYNLAAQSHVGLSFSQPTAAYRINAEGPLNILSVIRGTSDPSLTRFYQASTSEMFGNEQGPQNEYTALMPNSPYAIAKLAAHHTVRMFREAYGMYACSGILFNHESPRRGEKFVTRKITKYVAQLKMFIDVHGYEPRVKHIDSWGLGESTNLDFPNLKLGNLDACRDWGYAPDYVRAMHLMLNQCEPKDYVIGTGETHTIKEFLDCAFAAIDIQDWRPYVGVDKQFMRPSEVDYLLADPRKANYEIGWKPEVTFRQLVEIMVEADRHSV